MNERDVIPAKDSDFDVLQGKIYNQCNTNAVAWQIDPAKIAFLLPFKTNWDSAWLIARDFDNRTPVETRAKDLARAAYEAVLRPFIKALYINPAMNESNLESCGLTPHDTTRTPVPVPSTVPQVDTKPLPGHRVLIAFKQSIDESGVSRRGKPKGVAYCEFAYKLGGSAPVNPKDCPNKASATRSPGRVEFQTEEAGQKVYFFARWVNAKVEPGPWTNLNEFIVP